MIKPNSNLCDDDEELGNRFDHNAMWLTRDLARGAVTFYGNH